MRRAGRVSLLCGLGLLRWAAAEDGFSCLGGDPSAWTAEQRSHCCDLVGIGCGKAEVHHALADAQPAPAGGVNHGLVPTVASTTAWRQPAEFDCQADVDGWE